MSSPTDTPPGMYPLTGAATDAHRIRLVTESAYHHVDEQALRARRHAGSDQDFANINRELQLAMQHLDRARTLAGVKRDSYRA